MQVLHRRELISGGEFVSRVRRATDDLLDGVVRSFVCLLLCRVCRLLV